MEFQSERVQKKTVFCWFVQNYLREQRHTKFNLVCETLQFLDCICGSTTGGLGLLGLYINESNVDLITQALVTLTEYCQGPCHENQVGGVCVWEVCVWMWSGIWEAYPFVGVGGWVGGGDTSVRQKSVSSPKSMSPSLNTVRVLINCHEN